MSRYLLLHVGDEPALLTSRSEILREHFDVVEARSHQAFDRFMQGDFDGVVICGSVPAGAQRELVHRIYEYSPSTLIVQMSEFEQRDLAGVLWLAPFSPEKINRKISAALDKRHTQNSQTASG